MVLTPFERRNPAPQDPFFRLISWFSMLKKPVMCPGTKTELLMIKDIDFKLIKIFETKT